MWLRKEFSRSHQIYLISFFWTVCLSLLRSVDSESTIEIQPQQGIFLPLKSDDPFQLQMPEDAYPILQVGDVYQHLILDTEKHTAEALVVQDIGAPPELIWDNLLDFDHYESKISGVMTSRNHQTAVAEKSKLFKRPSQKPSFYSTKMMLGFPWILEVESYFQHEYRPKDDVLMWTLDHSRASDLDDSVGFWRIQALPDASSGLPRTRVTYKANVSWKKLAWFPEFLQQYLAQWVLTEAVTWIKTTSEQAFAIAQPGTEHRNDANLSGKDRRADRTTRIRLFPRKERSEVGQATSKSALLSSSQSYQDTGSSTVLSFTENTEKAEIGVARYLLVASILGLVVFNIYIYFSHYL